MTVVKTRDNIDSSWLAVKTAFATSKNNLFKTNA